MKKMLSAFALSLLFSLSCVAEAPVVDVIDDAQVELSVEEADALQRISNKIGDRYAELDLHKHIEAELQKVANENREDFDIALALRGVDAQDENGDIVRVIPVPAYYIIR
jgi:hypothetical protein